MVPAVHCPIHTIVKDGKLPAYRAHRWELTGLYEDGTITGQCSNYGYGLRFNAESYEVLASIGAPIPRVFCTCEKYAKNGECEHTIELIDWFTDELRRNSKSYNRLIKGKWSSGSPDSEIFPTEEREIVLSVLARMPTLANDAEENASLPDRNAAPPTRFLWDFTHGEAGFKLTPVLQKKKKRGNGWTKGRRMSGESFRAHVDGLSPIDITIRNGMYLDENYDGYSKHWAFPVPTALRVLKGSPSVLVNGQPGEIVDFAPKLSILELDGQLTIDQADSVSGQITIGFPTV